MSRYRDQLAAALRAVAIRGPLRYAWLGRTRRPVSTAVEALLDRAERRRELVGCLREELYWSFYCHGEPVAARWGEAGPVAADAQLELALSAANAGHGGWEPGWTIDRVEGEEAVLVRGPLRMRVRADEYRSSEGGLADVRRAKELRALMPGFYSAIGDAPWDQGSPLVRVYWNIAARGAPGLVASLTSRLNRAGAAFRLKVADHPFGFARRDAAVLYLPLHAFPSLRETLCATAVDAQLQRGTPALTLELARGVGLAEDGGDGTSFGSRRCALLAEAIVSAHEQRRTRLGDRLDVVAEHFAAAGVVLDAPYREPSLAQHVL
jgi:hypothetical protein